MQPHSVAVSEGLPRFKIICVVPSQARVGERDSLAHHTSNNVPVIKSAMIPLWQVKNLAFRHLKALNDADRFSVA